MLRLSRLDVSQLPAGYLTSLDQALGLVVKRPLSAGSVIYSSHLDKPVLIKRGTTVIITAAYGGVEATAPGIAQNNGRDGQFISVRNTATGRLITARVVDKERVQVALYEYK
jgi:flagella basal body P-ring formation protein FlgA